MTDWTLEKLNPFGLLVAHHRGSTDLRTIPVSALQQWVDDHRVLVLRKFSALEGTALPEFCQRLGELLEWDFGVVNNLEVRAEPNNYLYTNRAVPFHWDGAFAGRVPHYIFFHCDSAPASDSGGETLFCDTIRLLQRAAAERLETWKHVTITYATDKIVHYGGVFTSPVICRHPQTGEDVLRFAEPVVDLNPVRLEIDGIPALDQAAFLAEMHERLNDDAACYRHRWLKGDVVIADNRVLLHGRNAFTEAAERLIRRVNIL